MSTRRMPLAMRAAFQDLFLVTYAVAPDVLGRLLPPAIHPWVHGGRSYISIVVGNLRGMAPRPIPETFGTNYYQIVYRAVVAIRPREGPERRGVYFLRSDANDPVMSFFGNRLTEFRFHYFHTGAIGMFRRNDRVLVSVESKDGGGDLVVCMANQGAAEDHLPAAGFASVGDEKEILVELFNAYAHDTDNGCVYDLEVERGEWEIERLAAVDHFSAFFEEEPFTEANAELMSLLAIENCEYVWKPMKRIDVTDLLERK